MKNLFAGIILGIAVASVAACAQLPSSPAPAPVIPVSEVGRYQIVNGFPQTAMNIMLLDTVTGNTWISCRAPDTGNEWCTMLKTTSRTAPTK